MLLGTLYRRALRPILFSLDPETAHDFVLGLLARVPALRAPSDPPELAQRIWNLDFSNPVGLAAGMDKNGHALNAWQALGFGFAELGTVTPRPQAGNDRPRMWRLPERQALINRLGFPSEGIDPLATRLQRLRGANLKIRIAVNFGPNKDTPAEEIIEDYRRLMEHFAPLAHFIVINVSSPNTPGLRDWQAPTQLRSLLGAIRFEGQRDHTHPRDAGAAKRPPILVKLAPDLEPSQLEELCGTIVALGLDGIVATNTTIARDEIGLRSDKPGGVSGQPLKAKARSAIRSLHKLTRGGIPIIGVGGIAGAGDAYAHIRAGASLVELYTAMIYEGPTLAAEIKSGLCGFLKRDGFRSISEAVGIEA
jgi:dihydroorotate dehydrogenase